MIIYLAGVESYTKYISAAIDNLYEDYDVEYSPYLLMSYYYISRPACELIEKYDKNRLLIDSGAFSFMTGTQSEISWEEYIKKYAEFINAYDIKNFVELDIDAVVGYEKVKQLREMLETLTGKKCIPVWHKSRGLDEFYKSCEDYDYIALGGLVNKEISIGGENIRAFNTLTRYAWQHGTRIHALGYTRTATLKQCSFYSADSTTWLNGGRYGNAYYFDGEKIVKKHSKTRITQCQELSFRNLLE